MERHPLFRTPSLTVTPSGAGSNYRVEVADSGGAPVATCDAAGAVRDTGGRELLAAPLRWDGRGDKPTDAAIEVRAADGRPLGTGRVVKYGLGPRARKATVAVIDGQGGEAARLEPRDKRGEQLALTADGTQFASIDVAVIKRGFLRKGRVYTVALAEQIPDDMRPLALALAIRYDALLNAVASAAARD
jgi:hypothetical protein